MPAPRLPVRPWWLIAACSVLTTAVITGVTFFVEEILHGMPKFQPIELVDDMAGGLAAGAIVFVLLARTRGLRQRLKRRLRLIETADQQIESAIQVILNTTAAGTREQYIIMQASDHIRWVLDEILPRMIENGDAPEPPKLADKLKG